MLSTSVILAIFVLSTLGLLFAKKIMHMRIPVTFGQLNKQLVTSLKEQLDGVRCRKCKERYIGLALDCRCTNWGK